jgi:hypothetical protein
MTSVVFLPDLSFDNKRFDFLGFLLPVKWLERPGRFYKQKAQEGGSFLGWKLEIFRF